MTISSLNGVTIQWTNSDGNSINNNNTLVIANVIPSLHNTMYTCTVAVETNPKNCGFDENTIVLNIKGMV